LHLENVSKEKSIQRTKELRTELKLAQSKIDSQKLEIRNLQKNQENMMVMANEAVHEVELAGNQDQKVHTLEVEIELSKSKIKRSKETISLQNATIDELRSEHEKTNQLICSHRVETEKLRKALQQKNRDLFEKLAEASHNLMEGEHVKKLMLAVKTLNSQLAVVQGRMSQESIVSTEVAEPKADEISEIIVRKSARRSPKIQRKVSRKNHTEGTPRRKSVTDKYSLSTPPIGYRTPKVKPKYSLKKQFPLSSSKRCSGKNDDTGFNPLLSPRTRTDMRHNLEEGKQEVKDLKLKFFEKDMEVARLASILDEKSGYKDVLNKIVAEYYGMPADTVRSMFKNMGSTSSNKDMTTNRTSISRFKSQIEELKKLKCCHTAERSENTITTIRKSR